MGVLSGPGRVRVLVAGTRSLWLLLTLDEEWVEDDDNEDGSTQETSTPDLADHALVLVFRPYLARWIQPICVFASKSAASGVELRKNRHEGLGYPRRG
jgi:hypothetical protein